MKNKLLLGLILTGLTSGLVCLAAEYGYDNPIAHNTLTDFFKGLLASIQGIAGWLSVIFIVIGGLIYMTASGKQGQIELAKKTILYSLIGFGIAVAGPSLLKEIKDILLGSGSELSIDEANPILNIITNVMSFLLTTVVVLSMISLIYSGFTFLTSQGNNKQIDKAKNISLYSIIALLVSGGSIILIKTILSLLDI